MRIERLTLDGFKSFGDRTTLQFDEAVTAIVGPNGSGKSNVLDALKWATGGGRAKAFRADDKTDLIFHGADGKKRMGRAEVEVELRSPSKALKIRRTLDADGQGRLTLDGRAARFLDLEDELSGSGIGKGALAIIGQGEVASVLMADADRLLAFVAEAAGVSRLTGRREQTEARLQAARGHLDRVELRSAEDQARIVVLEREAADARRHREATVRLQRLRVTLADLRVVSTRSSLLEARSTVTVLEERLAMARERLDGVRAEVASRRADDERAEREFVEASTVHARAVADLRVLEHEARAATQRASDLEQRRDTLHGERERLVHQQPPQAPMHDLPAMREWQEETAALASSLVEAVAEADRAAADARSAREAAEERARRAALIEAERSSLHGRLTAEADEIRRRLDVLGDAPSPTLFGPDSIDEESSAVAAFEGAEGHVERARADLSVVHARHANVVAEVMARERAVERARAGLEARRGYAEGPRHALSSGIEGVLGSVADVIDVDPVHRDAIAAALGRRAEYVLCSTADVARAVLSHVRERGGWVTLLPLDLVTTERVEVPKAIVDERGVLGTAVDFLDVPDRFRSAVAHLLGSTVVVDDMTTATEVARRHSRRPRMVTLRGEVLETGGAMSGGRRDGSSIVLGAAAELEEAERTHARLVREADDLSAAVTAAQTAVRDAVAARDEASAAVQRARAAAASWRETVAVFEAARADLIERAAAIDATLRAMAHDRPDDVATGVLDDLRRVDVTTSTRAAELREALTTARERGREAESTLLLAEERERSHREALARFELDSVRLHEVEGEIDRVREAVTEAWSTANDLEERLATVEAALPEDPSRLASARSEARHALVEAEQRAERQAAVIRADTEALESARVSIARFETTLELAEGERAEFPEDFVPLEDVSERAARQEVRTLTTVVEELGEVNHRAITEVEVARLAWTERERDLHDARAAVDELATALSRLDAETTERLTKAIGGVQQRFAEHVTELFGSTAVGEIVTDLVDGRPVGLRIGLQPPGKRTRSLSLLSVGERTMGALAFLFALMSEEHGGARLPIAVLDEVDAPLDEANIRRFRAFVERLAADGTQFVLITHQKATFEVARALWGVTTDGGVSRVFSIRR